MDFFEGLGAWKDAATGGEFWMLNFFLTRRREDAKEGRWGKTGRAVVSAAGAFFGLWFVEGDEGCFF
jgi:hypothetical protein